MPRKRTYDEISTASPAPAPRENGMLHKIRNMWEFASLFEWIVLFGQAAKLPSIDVEDFEMECVKPQPSQTLEDIGFRLVNWISSRRDINIENWDEHVRRQYIYKAPNMSHPYGEEEEPNAFRDFHIMTKIRVLHQLTVWTFWNPDKIRQAFPDVKEAEQFDYWQIHPIGWDREDRAYYYFSGDRLYRRTDPPIPVDKPKPKSTSKKGQAQRRKSRASKRRKVAVSDEDDTEMGEVDETQNETMLDDSVAVLPTDEQDPEKINTFGNYKFECVAVTLDEYNAFLATLAKTKDLNEQNLRSFVQAEVLPALEAQEEKRQRKLEAQLREIQMAEKMQGAKRSGRLAAKQEREKEEAEAAEAERQRLATLAEARKEQRRLEQMDNDRQSRMMTREQRIKDREMKRVLMEDQLARDAEEAERIETEGVRASRHLKERIEKRKQELEDFEDDEWTFDCSGCHQYGKNFDDGEHSIACERCNVWQHSKCLGITKAAAESEDFHFVCKDCRRREEDANRPKISLKFRIGQSSSPPQPTTAQPIQTHQPESPVKQRLVSVDMPASQPLSRPAPPNFATNGQSYPPQNPFQPMQQLPQPQLVATRAHVTPYAVQPVQQTQVNGTSHVYPGAPTYAPRDRLPGSEHAQNLYNQLTFPNNGVPQLPRPPNQASHLPPQPSFRPSSSHSQTPRPASSHSHVNGQSSPARPRIASPIVNKPTMSPTQGNPEVGPIAGVPGSSPIPQPATIATPHTNGHHHNGLTHRTPVQAPLPRNPSYSFDQQGDRLPMSGLSPTKQRTSLSPVPPPSNVLQKQDSFTTPSSSFTHTQNSRTVSGTPIFPPVENLAPSPHQLNRGPVPTPSKQSPPPPSRPPQLQSFSSMVSHVSSTPTPSQQEQNGDHANPLPQQQPGTVQ